MELRVGDIIRVPVGAADFLVQEVESLRRQREIAEAQLNVMNGFFELIGRLQGRPNTGQGTDMLYQAKRDIQTAKEEAKANLPMAGTK